MHSLEDRRIILSASFMYKLMYDFIDVPCLKENIIRNNSMYVTRNRPILICNNHSTSYGLNEPMTRLIRLFNLYHDEFENCNSIDMLKNSIRSKL